MRTALRRAAAAATLLAALASGLAGGQSGTPAPGAAPSGSATAAGVPSPADSASLGAFYRDWSRAAMSQGPDGYAAAFAESAVMLPADGPPLKGREAVRGWFVKNVVEGPFRAQPQGISVDEIRVMGDWAIYRTTIRGLRVPKAGGEGKPFESKYFDLLRRKPGGGWEFAYRMWNSNRGAPEAGGPTQAR